MILPFDNDTRPVERKIAKRSFRAERLRNIFAVAAIIMTTVLFTALLTLGSGMAESTRRADMILSGGDGHARFINLDTTEYDRLRTHPLIEEMAYCRKLADHVDNEALSKRETIFWYYDEPGMEDQFVNPTNGRKPVKENEIIADTKTLELLGVPKEIGAGVSLELTVHGKKVVRSFVLAGWWESYPGLTYGTIVSSKAYVDAHEDELINTFLQDHVDTGTITGIVKFKNDKNIEASIKTVIEDCGYSDNVDAKNYINGAANPLYLTAKKSSGLGTVLAFAFAIFVFLLTGYLVIYNVFQISVIKDLHFYGLLKTIGTTQRQIYSIIRRQALKLSAIGIPVGLSAGFLCGKAFLPMIMEKSSMSRGFATVSLNPFIFIASALFTLLTVGLSIRRPAKMAAKVPPVEALRQSDSGKAVIPGKRRKRYRTGKKALHKRMAWGNLKRNKKRTILVVLSLSLSMVLANGVFHIAGSVDPQKAIKNMIVSDFCIGSSRLLDYYEIDEKNALDEAVIERIKQQPGFVQGGREYGCKAEYTSQTTAQTFNQLDNGHFSTHLYGLEELLLLQLQAFDEKMDLEKHADGELDLEKHAGGELDLEKLASGDYILEGVFANSRGEVDESSINHKTGDKVQIFYNGKVREFTVLAHVIANESNTYDWVGSCFFLPAEIYTDFTGNGNLAMTYHFDVEQGSQEEMEAFLKNYTANEEPALTYKSKATIMAGAADIQNIVLSIGGMMTLIIGTVGVLNFVNTILTSIFTRRRELATLQSIGMTQKQTKKMLCREGCGYVILSTLLAVPLCIFSTWMVVRPICEQVWFLDFKVNVWPLAVILLLLFVVGIKLPYIIYPRLQRQSLMERLKNGE